MLTEGGIAADRITRAARLSAYIATDATPAGRALNRRVDINLQAFESMAKLP